MHADCLVAEFRSMEKAKVALEVLQLNDFASDAVSVVYRGHEEALEQIDQQAGYHVEPGDVEHSMELGAVMGASLATYVSVATLMVPVIVAGPLVGLVAGAAAGRFFAEAKQWGIHEHDAMHYDQRVANGSVLVIVTSTPLRLNEAEQCLKTTGPVSLERFARQHGKVKLQS